MIVDARLRPPAYGFLENVMYANRARTVANMGSRGFTAPPSMTYLVHGEPKALNALRERVAARGWNVHVPHHGETVSI